MPSQSSYFRIGDLDVPGNKITVEAVINRTSPYTGGQPYAGDVVSKHTGPSDVNYLLRPNDAEITTSNGYFRTPDICDIELNKTYHIALVYDGSTLKFYRNGFLMSQVAATGNLYQNNWNTQIGIYDGLTLPEQFIGYVNEVRIWNVARTQADIQAYMNTSLPSPATQTGLLAYYTFDDLLNKQGNPAWNGTLGGPATINNTNSNCTYIPDSCKAVTIGFTTPDTVCLTSPVTINNTSLNATTYYWNFCVGNINTPPSAVNIGNPGSLSAPVFMDYVYTGGNYYGFVTNYASGNLVRLNFGNSLLNTPTSTNLGNYGGILQSGSATEGIQVVQNEGNWYAIIVGGNSAAGTQPRLVKIDFGANITSAGTATNWGNLGNMDQAVDLHVFKEGNNWYGLTVSAENNSITRFNFTNSFNNTPTGVNLGNIGGLQYPTGIYAINDNGFWRVFVTNGGDRNQIGTASSITRLDFGSSLLNTPTGVNLGNPGGILHHPRDLTILKFCGQITGFAVNGNPSYYDLVRLNFNNDLTTSPTATSLGNTGNYSFPHSISKLFRVNDDVYAFITNVANNTISRLRFAGCTNASVSSSTLQNPAPVTYSTPGTYNINLTIDDGLPTQASFCKQVVVVAPPVHTPTQSYTLCSGNTIKIGTGVKNAKYTWNTGATTDSITVNTGGVYWVQTDVFGCTNRDSIIVSSCVPVTAQFTTPDSVCLNTPVNITNTTTGATTYYWNFCVGNINNPPSAVNIGNPGNLSVPVFMDYAYANGNYYAFVSNHTSGSLVRLDFGNSLLNTPASVNLGNYGGILQTTSAAEGIQVVQNEGKWYVIIVGGSTISGTQPRIVKIDFGANITSAGTATNWGNLGNMEQPIDLHVFKEGNNWYGFTVNADNYTLTRFNFTNSFNNTPTAINMGNIGGLSYPTGIYAINDNGFWRVFITNAGVTSSPSITRLDFGASLLNTPTPVNLGNPGGKLHSPRDLTIMKFCGQITGFVVNGDQSYNDLVRLNFGNDLTATPTATSLGNTGNYSFPHSISKLFRVNDDVYAFITNAASNTISRLRFAGCTNASVSSSTLKDPLPVTYSAPGTYNINLTIDDGLPTQASFCKQVVVMAPPTHTPAQTYTICSGNSIKIGTGVKNAKYSWNTGATTDSIIVNTSGIYWVQTDVFGCTNRDSIIVSSCNPVIAQFSAPDTVCITTPVTIANNSSSNASSYYWTFCTGNLNAPPAGANLGVLNGSLTSPVYIDYVQDNGKYYGFMTDNYTGQLFRLEFGTSLLNTPTTYNLGNFGSIIPVGAEGIQVIKNEGKWYAIIVGGTVANNTVPRILKIEFGTNIANNTPVATNWGNIGGLAYPHDLYVFPDNNGVWYGLTVNSDNNTITRFNFTNSFSNTPTGTNLGNIGTLSGPTGIYAINDGGNWYAFVTNAVSSTLTRLDFGSSLLNNPTGTNLGNIGGQFHSVWDIQVIKYCGNLLAYVINADQSYNSILKLDFNNNITSIPTAVNFGNIGNMKFPHCLSKIFRAGADLYTFVPNVANQTVTRISFAGCNNASIPNSTAQNPGPITYNTPGTYNINLTLDDGLPTQTAFCKQVVVLPEPVHTPTKTINLCTGDSVKIGTGVKYAQYTWNTGDKTDSITVKTAGTYWVQTDRYGCSNRDSVIINIVAKPVVNLGADTLVCTFTPFTLDAGNAGATYLWQNGSTAQTFTPAGVGKYYVRVTNAAGCVGSDTIVISQQTKGNTDYVYKQDVCNPLNVQFIPAGNPLTNPSWDFGDGNTTTGSLNTTHSYAAFGTYTVKFAIANGVCKDTIIKNISVNVTQSDIVLTPDTTICFNGTGQLRAKPALSFCWSPTTYLNNPNIPNPVTSTPGTTTYYYTAEVPGTNLVVNSDFNLGNTGFGSGYAYTTRNINEGEYYVGPRPQAWNLLLGTCTDHTTGTGNMLLVNGASQPNVAVWTQTINITPNTNYAFSAWLQNINVNNAASNPPNLQFSINGIPIGNNLQGRNAMCVWDQFYTTWNSGNNTTANISIVNKNTVASGNDFALDDISFAPVFIQRDSVIVTVDTPLVKTINDTTICKNTPVQLQATGAVTWSWLPATGLSNATISNPIATPLANTQYIVTGTNVHGCTAKDTVQINLFPEPVIFTSHDTIICPNTSVHLSANPALASWNWTPPATLSNPAIPDPVATPTATTTYTVAVTDGNTCNYTDTIRVAIKKMNVTASVLNAAVCQGDSTQLSASGGVTYQWSPATGVNNTAIANPKVAPTVTTDYKVIVTDATGCIDSATVQVVVKPVPPHTPIQSVSICTGSSIKIGTGILNAQYTWNTGNSNQDSMVVNTGGTYWVQSVVNGCSNKDSITVTLLPNPVVNLGPDVTDCAINNLVLNAGNAGSQFLWQDGSIAPTFTANAFGKYYVRVTDANGCFNSDTINLIKTTARLGDFTFKIDACNPLSVQFTGTGATIQNPYWAYGDGNTTTGTATTTYVYPAYGDYTVKFGLQSGYCKDTITKTVPVHVTPANIIATSDTTICFNTTKQLQAQQATNFCWSPTTWLSNPNVVNPVTSTPSTITYYYTAEINGAILRDSVTITIDSPVVKTNNDTTICKDAQVPLHATGAVSWSWLPVTGLSNAAIGNPVATPTATTQYIVTGTTIHGCSAKDTVNITLYPVPTVISNHNLIACRNTPVQLNANSALTAWTWSPAATLNNPAIANPVATPAADTKYLVKVTDANNCNYTDSVTVQLQTTQFTVSNNKPQAICKGESVVLKATGGNTYLWSPAGSLSNAGLPNPIATPDTSTLYSVYIKENVCNNDTTINVQVVVKPSPIVTAEKSNDLDCVTHTTRLSATGTPGNTYVWSPASGLDHPYSPNPVSSTDTTVTYVVAGTKDGCTTLDSITVNVTSTGKVSFEIPNAFTPNNDGRNDCFGVKTWGGVVIEEFTIFNRWGQKVFSSNKENACWDGRFNGIPQPGGGYVYVIKAKTYCGPIKRTGTLILVR
ncbi:PKD domain containing protein [Niastella koreensis GR20-10]|uniref:PKD domain containing protein n=1 Tax=Niastella koreensis (strain DSM 17620 / KACC 11465 / NBRC 106392 / GR20-10) TaxID=700598 RepID=G8TDB1_NIAKG|nr:gliding motility-associated C-terminal domain-containing protein [Niastella koreensis]AEV99351.1 PKD domain containing protein [Niastella koreensis GR20-10]